MFTDEELQTVIAGRPVGDREPYRSGDAAAIERSLSNFVKKLKRSKLLCLEADFSSYGSGYASYVPVFCYKSKGASTEHQGSQDVITGVLIYLSRLAPIAVWGPEMKFRSPTGSSGGFLEPQGLYETPRGDWGRELSEVTGLFDAYNFALPPREWLSRPLGFEAEIETILAEPPYRVFDALFYWED